MTTDKISEIVERLEGGANAIAIDGTPSQVGPSVDTLHEAARIIQEQRAMLEEAVKRIEVGLEYAIEVANEGFYKKDGEPFKQIMRDIERMEATLSRIKGEVK